MRQTTPRPFLWWPGGKTRQTRYLLAARPKKFQVYHEPFLGSGALFFALYRKGLLAQQKPAAVLSDTDHELIDAYLAVRDHADDVMRLLDTYPHNKSFYRLIARQPPSSLSIVERAAQFIYLNKTSFAGLMQKTQRGYRAPRHYATTTSSRCYYVRDNIIAVAQALREADILCTSYEVVLQRARPGDWVYLDPPYHSSDNRLYNCSDFGDSDQKKVADVFAKLDKSGVYVLATNSDTDFVRSLYHGFNIKQITTCNQMSWNRKTKRQAELIIANYPINIDSSQLFPEL